MRFPIPNNETVTALAGDLVITARPYFGRTIFGLYRRTVDGTTYALCDVYPEALAGEIASLANCN